MSQNIARLLYDICVTLDEDPFCIYHPANERMRYICLPALAESLLAKG